MSLFSFLEWGWSPHFENQLSSPIPWERLGRVVVCHVNRVILRGPWGECDLQVGFQDLSVGDWVLLRHEPEPDLMNLIELQLTRRSVIERAQSGGRRQVLAANVDLALLVTSPGEDFSPARLQRYRLLAESGGVRCLVVLNKVDTQEDLKEELKALDEQVPDLPRVLTSAQTGAGLAELRGFLEKGQSLVLLGSSGVGKSSLTNALLGEDSQKEQANRRDGKGRHTTTHRELVLLPEGACLIDVPGLREVSLTAEVDPDSAFPEIAELSLSCRFRDCQHGPEPGCRVKEALSLGELSEARWRQYAKFEKEVSFQRRREIQRQRKK